MEHKEPNILQQNFAGGLMKASCDKGVFPHETLKLTQENLNFIHNMGNQLYEQGQYDQAESIFQFLCTLKPTGQQYWLGLGATQQMKCKYKQAIFSYKFATTLDLEDPKAAFHAAECHLQLNQKLEAQDALEIAIASAKQNSRHSHIAEQAEKLLEKTH